MKNKIKLLFLSLALLLTASCTRIGPGYVGLEVNLAGGDRGSSKVQPVYGWEAYFPPTTTIVKINTRNQHFEIDQPMVVQAKGGTNVIVHPSFNYRIDGAHVDSLYLVWGITDDQQIQGKLLDASLLTNMREVTNGWSIDSLLNYRSAYDHALEIAMNAKLHPYAVLFQFTSGVTPDESMAKAIAEKAGSIQKAITAENQRRETQALADLQIINARRDSSLQVIAASAEAKSTLITMTAEAAGIKLKQQEITPTYVDYIKWSNAGENVPRVPGVITGNGGTLLNIK